MGISSGLYQISAGYRGISRYFFFALVVIGLIGTVTGVFAQSQQQPQLTLIQSNVKVSLSALYETSITFATGMVTVQGPWSGGPLHFGGWIAVTDDKGVINDTISSSNFSPSSLNYPSATASNFTYDGHGRDQVLSYVLVINAYDQSGQLVGTTGQQTGVGAGGSEANLFILAMEIPLFQVPQLGISASSPDFSSLFSTFDQLPLGDFYMLFAEVAVILLVGAALINIIMYLTGSSENQKGGTAGTLAGLNNIFVTLLLILLLPYAYDAVASFVNVLDQQIIAGPGNPYTDYLTDSQLIWNTLPTGGNVLTDLIGAIASLMAWAMSWLLGSARIFLIGAVTVAMPIVLVLRNIKFTARLAGVVEDTFFGLIFASVISALFIGLAAYILNNWNGSMFQAASVDKTWVALAALMGAILVPTIFAPMTGVFFQTMSQVGMAAAGTAVAVGAGALGPAGAGVKGGLAMAGQALGAMAMNNPTAGVLQKTGAALGGFGGGFSRSVMPMGQNMLLMGTVGTLGGIGAGRQASSINRAIDLKMPGQTTQTIMAYRGGTLTNELKLPEEMKGIVSRALGGKVPHDKIRELDMLHHNNLDKLRDALETEISNRRMR
ncbi:MAG: hypothetical protein ACRD6W_04835 [Nitrososphaerales archaeon]